MATDRFGVFVSHTGRSKLPGWNCKDFVYYNIVKPLQDEDITVFFDVVELKGNAISTCLDAVANSQLVLAVMDDQFPTPWCISEMKVAVEKGIPVIPVYNQTYFPKFEDLRRMPQWRDVPQTVKSKVLSTGAIAFTTSPPNLREASVAEMVKVIGGKVTPVSKSPSFVVIGNPGAGKSSLLNSFVGRALFKAGPVDDGRGLTAVLDVKNHNGVAYMDTPGLADVHRRMEAGKAIDQALDKGGIFRVVFVMQMDSGRLRPDDLATMKLVCEAANQIADNRYGIIFNKCGCKWLKNFRKDGKQDKFESDLLHELKSKGIPLTTHIHYAPYVEDLEDEHDAVVELDSETQNFLVTIPEIRIQRDKLKNVQTKSWDEVLYEMQQQHAAEQEDMKRLLEEARAAAEKQRQDDQQRFLDQQAQFEKQRKEQQAVFEQQRKEFEQQRKEDLDRQEAQRKQEEQQRKKEQEHQQLEADKLRQALSQQQDQHRSQQEAFARELREQRVRDDELRKEQQSQQQRLLDDQQRFFQQQQRRQQEQQRQQQQQQEQLRQQGEFAGTVAFQSQRFREYLYAGGPRLDRDRRLALTWKNSGTPHNDRDMVWELFRYDGFYGLRHKKSGEWLYSGNPRYDERRQHVLTWGGAGDPTSDLDMRWLLQNHAGYYSLKSLRHGKFLYAGNISYDDDRRYAFLWMTNDTPECAEDMRWTFQQL